MLFEEIVPPLIEKLQRLQNTAIQLISKESELADLNELFTDLSILNIQQLIDFNTTNMVCDSINGNCPEYLTNIFIPAQRIHNYRTRHANHGLFPSHTNLVAGQRTFQSGGCHLWNSLPQHIQCATTSQNFKKSLFKCTIKQNKVLKQPDTDSKALHKIQ